MPFPTVPTLCRTISIFSVTSKYYFRDNRCSDDEDVKTTVTSWLLSQAPCFYEDGIQNVVVKYNKCLKKNLAAMLKNREMYVKSENKFIIVFSFIYFFKRLYLKDSTCKFFFSCFLKTFYEGI